MLFVYGTLRDPDILAALLGRPLESLAIRPATAPDHRAVYYPGRVYPALVPAPRAIAEGLLLAPLSSRDLALFDAFEGEEYRRGALTVLCDGEAVSAQAYLPVQPIGADAPAWTLETWTRLHKPAVLAAEQTMSQSLRSMPDTPID